MTDIKDYICTVEFNITYEYNHNVPVCVININTPEKFKTLYLKKYKIQPGDTLTVGPFECLGRI